MPIANQPRDLLLFNLSHLVPTTTGDMILRCPTPSPPVHLLTLFQLPCYDCSGRDLKVGLFIRGAQLTEQVEGGVHNELRPRGRPVDFVHDYHRLHSLDRSSGKSKRMARK